MKRVNLRSLTPLAGFFLLCVLACNSGPLYDAQVVKDAHATLTEAEAAYKAATSEAGIYYQLTSSTDYGKAWDKFGEAKDKYSLAGEKFDNARKSVKNTSDPFHRKFSKLSEGYKKWSEMAGVEQEHIMKHKMARDMARDPLLGGPSAMKPVQKELSDLEEKAKKLRLEVNALIEASRS